MNPRAEKILKQIRDLPMTDVRELFNQFHYAEEWVSFDADGQRTGSVKAEASYLTCIKEDSPVELLKKNERWHIQVIGKSVGTAPDLRTAQDMAEAELELLGYYIPWRK
jgi:hypothetical protein